MRWKIEMGTKIIIISCLILICSIELILGKPTKSKTAEKSAETTTAKIETHEASPDDVEYARYLEEVINALEEDPKFKKQLESANIEDIKSGKVAHHLDVVDHQIRTKLDEIKRRELQRLRELATDYYEMTHDIDREHLKVSDNDHIDHENAHSFEVEDLKKLIKETARQMDLLDEQRRKEFKNYELEKEYEKNEKLHKMTNETEKKEYEHHLEELKKKHDDHPKIHHPGSKQQLEEVWQEQDHMKDNEFDPKTFFHFHDLDGNGYWDDNEVGAMMVKEVSKVYEEGHEEDDPMERAEEIQRMREHIFNEMDKNNDNLIGIDEFLDETKDDDFEKDPGWETVDHEPQYTQEEYNAYEILRHEIDKSMHGEDSVLDPKNISKPDGQHHERNLNKLEHNIPEFFTDPLSAEKMNYKRQQYQKNYNQGQRKHVDHEQQYQNPPHHEPQHQNQPHYEPHESQQLNQHQEYKYDPPHPGDSHQENAHYDYPQDPHQQFQQYDDSQHQIPSHRDNQHYDNSPYLQMDPTDFESPHQNQHQQNLKHPELEPVHHEQPEVHVKDPRVNGNPPILKHPEIPEPHIPPQHIPYHEPKPQFRQQQNLHPSRRQPIPPPQHQQPIPSQIHQQQAIPQPLHQQQQIPSQIHQQQQIPQVHPNLNHPKPSIAQPQNIPIPEHQQNIHQRPSGQRIPRKRGRY